MCCACARLPCPGVASHFFPCFAAAHDGPCCAMLCTLCHAVRAGGGTIFKKKSGNSYDARVEKQDQGGWRGVALEGERAGGAGERVGLFWAQLGPLWPGFHAENFLGTEPRRKSRLKHCLPAAKELNNLERSLRAARRPPVRALPQAARPTPTSCPRCCPARRAGASHSSASRAVHAVLCCAPAAPSARLVRSAVAEKPKPPALKAAMTDPQLIWPAAPGLSCF